MYVYYEHFPGITQSEDLLELVLSSNGRVNSINWNSNQEKAIQVLISNILKSVPFNQREYDGKDPNKPNHIPTHIWTFLGIAGLRVITVIETGKTQGLFPNLEIKKIKNLQEKCKRGRLDAPDIIQQAGPDEILFKEEEFFYAPAPAGQISGEALFSKLAATLSITVDQLKSANEIELKKIYRRAALQYHPDRNNGDGSKMSELNMLWHIYQGN